MKQKLRSSLSDFLAHSSDIILGTETAALRIWFVKLNNSSFGRDFVNL
ncbi:MAG TPA: hypothetical protein PK397_13415 [Ignavibacteriaceae bacterium]|nr:hypothetical protein [Ignavibacteriaceae bacterium]